MQDRLVWLAKVSSIVGVEKRDAFDGSIIIGSIPSRYLAAVRMTAQRPNHMKRF